MVDRSDQPRKRWRALLALALVVPVPSVAIFVATPDTSGFSSCAASAFYVASKVWMFALPLVWRLIVDRRPISWSPSNQRHIAQGLALGVLIAVFIVAARLALGVEWIDGDGLRANLAANGVDEPAEFVALAAGLSLFNALAEEIVWRWFVVEKCIEALPSGAASWSVPIAAACFTLHHIFALDAHFRPVVTVLGAAGVFAGGWIWSALYRHTRSIWPGYASHVLVDVTLMAIGYHLLFQ